MKKGIITGVLVVCMLASSCNFDQTDNFVSSNHSDVVSVKIINHTPNHYIKKETRITDRKDIQDICKQVRLLKEVHDVNVKANFGFYEVKIVYSNIEEHLDVIYTTYDGVVVYSEDTNKTYKNDQLEGLMRRFLNKGPIPGWSDWSVQ